MPAPGRGMERDSEELIRASIGPMLVGRELEDNYCEQSSYLYTWKRWKY